MILPSMSGSVDQKDFFVYTAADSVYFDNFGKQFIQSIKHNTNYGVHIHLYDPTPEQLNYCLETDKVSFTYEKTTNEQFKPAIEYWSRDDLSELDTDRKRIMVDLMTNLNKWYPDDDLIKWIYKTYYASMRFVRLAEIINHPCKFINLDIDALVRAPIQIDFDNENDMYVYTNHNGNYLAGSIFYPAKESTVKFIKELGNNIKEEIEKDNLYWFLDQYCLDAVANKYKVGFLPKDYIDWDLKTDTAIWTLKGWRKKNPVFIEEAKKYLQ